MPLAPKLPATGIGEKIQQLAEKLPYKEWYMPDPYNPATMVQPIGGLTLSKAKSLMKLAEKMKRGAPLPNEYTGAISLPKQMEGLFNMQSLEGQQGAVNFLRSFAGVKSDKPFEELLHQIDFLIDAMKRSKRLK